MGRGCRSLDAWIKLGPITRCVDGVPVYVVREPGDYEALIEECGLITIIDASERGLLAYCAEKDTELYIDIEGERRLLIYIEPMVLLEKIRRPLGLVV